MSAAVPETPHPAAVEAQLAQQHGYRVFPVRIVIDDKGKKNPLFSAEWRTAPAQDPGLLTAIANAQGYAIDCGASGIVGVDLDCSSAANGLALWEQRGYPDSPLSTDTQGGGRHLFFRADPAHSHSIASFGKLGIDIRGDGGLLFGPGTQVASGGLYERDGAWLPVSSLPVIPTALVAQLAAENTALKQRAAADARPELFGGITGDQVAQCQAHVDREFALLEQSVDGGFNDQLNRYCYWVGRLFATWDAMGQPGDLSMDAAIQYVVDAFGDSNVIDPPDRNDMKTIASSSGLRGGMKAPFTAPVAISGVEDIYSGPPGLPAGAGETATPGAEGRRGWGLEDLGPYLAGTYVPPPASELLRSDGAALLYPGRVNWLQGESESGKSWVAQAAAAQAAIAGRDVLYLDFESNPGEIVDRFKQLGVPPEVIAARISYTRPYSGAIANPQASGFAELLTKPYALVVIDGVTDALGTENLSMMNNDEVAKWVRLVLRPIADHTGAAVVCVDHVTKSKDERGRFAIGAQAKMAGLSGAAYTVEVTGQLGIGLRGTISIRVAKDRPGTIRALGVDYRDVDRTAAVAVMTLDSTAPGKVVATIDPATERPLSEQLEDQNINLPWDPLNPPVVGSVLQNPARYLLASGQTFNGRKAVYNLACYMATAATGDGAGRSRAEAQKFFADAGMGSRPVVADAWDRLLESGALKPVSGTSRTGPHLWMGAVDIIPDAWVEGPES